MITLVRDIGQVESHLVRRKVVPHLGRRKLAACHALRPDFLVVAFLAERAWVLHIAALPYGLFLSDAAFSRLTAHSSRSGNRMPYPNGSRRIRPESGSAFLAHRR